jgi:macrolide transport system ATP-binding/permease protein
LIETVLLCLIGGAFGIGVAIGFGVVFNAFDLGFKLIFSTMSIVVAVVSCTTIGVTFGYTPARNASRLDPVVALSRE